MYSMHAVYVERQDFNLHPGNESCIIARTVGSGKQLRASTLIVPPYDQSDWPAPVSVTGRGATLISIWLYRQWVVRLLCGAALPAAAILGRPDLTWGARNSLLARIAPRLLEWTRALRTSWCVSGSERQKIPHPKPNSVGETQNFGVDCPEQVRVAASMRSWQEEARLSAEEF